VPSDDVIMSLASADFCVCGAVVKTILTDAGSKTILWERWEKPVNKKWAAHHGVTAPKSFSVGSAQNMKNGDYRKLPQSSSPLWMSQWAVQGTAKAPYIVSKKVFAANYSASTTDQGWACSCPNFTQHTPRTECKHILKVMLGEGVKPGLSPDLSSCNYGAPVASLPDDQQDAFQKFLRQQAERGTPALPAGKTKDLFAKGRRFR